MTTELATLFRAFAKKYPKPTDESTWDQMCAAETVRFNEYVAAHYKVKWDPTFFGNAIDVYKHSHIEGKKSKDAPVGAYHWWSIGKYGHVGQDLTGGGKQIDMATLAVTTSLGRAIGWTSEKHYTSIKDAKYLGWSLDYAGARPHIAKTTSTASTGSTTAVTAPTKEKDMAARPIKIKGNPATWLIFDGLTPPFEASVAEVRRFEAQYGVTYIEQVTTGTGKQTDAVWAAFIKDTTADWNAESTRKLAAIKAAIGPITSGTVTNVTTDDSKIVTVLKAIATAITTTLGK